MLIAITVFIGLTFGIVVLAGNENNYGRYFISGSDFNINVVRVIAGESRHEFENGFSGDFAPGQIKVLKALSGMFDISIEPVGIYYITEGGDDFLSDRVSGESDPNRAARAYFPSDRTPWGIEKMYNNPGIVSTAGGSGVDVAVLDTGVYKRHLDLWRRVGQCKDFTGKVAVKNGSCADKNGHGTHVAGTILADGGSDGLGIYGMAPEAKLFAYKVCNDSGSCSSDDIARAIRMAADKGAEIISMSFGSDAENSLVRDAISYAVNKNVLIVAAAGNDGSALGSIDYPGANANVIAVGAIDVNENIPNWSSRGINNGDYIITEKEVEFGAPGVDVESTWIGGKYNTSSGTSMATPHISGLAAKLWQGSAASTREYLHSIVRDILPIGDDPATGFGLPFVQ